MTLTRTTAKTNDPDERPYFNQILYSVMRFSLKNTYLYKIIFSLVIWLLSASLRARYSPLSSACNPLRFVPGWWPCFSDFPYQSVKDSNKNNHLLSPRSDIPAVKRRTARTGANLKPNLTRREVLLDGSSTLSSENIRKRRKDIEYRYKWIHLYTKIVFSSTTWCRQPCDRQLYKKTMVLMVATE